MDIIFSEKSLRYMLFTLGSKIVREYLDNPIDEEDAKVLDALVRNEITILLRNISD